MGPRSGVTRWFRTFLAGLLIMAILASLARFWSGPHRRAVRARDLIEAGRYDDAYEAMDRSLRTRLDSDMMRVARQADGFANYLARRWADRDGRSFPTWGFLVVHSAALRGAIERPTLDRLTSGALDDERTKTIARDVGPRPVATPGQSHARVPTAGC